MGSKSESKDIMIKANVPVTPGYHGQDQRDEHLHAEARKIGYPVMIKAVAGGGGKGMRAVFKDEDFLEALNSARRESLKSFSDDQVLIEKLVQAPRHVELQVFGDTHGDAVHLLERDCSIQRRHQKVLEEAPAPNLSPEVCKAMGDAAVACAKAVGYVGAGTVEFLVDSVTSDFYFCEMNTRLQVEHPVTEMITGLDLVEWQLRIASGQPIPLSQDEILKRAKGCAIEARVYAENPTNGFLPSTGRIVHMQTPADMQSGEEGIRVDGGVRSGDTVSTFYDPMIAKLIAYADSRPEAVKKLERALRNFQVAGLANNIDFLVKTVRHPGFAVQQPTTAFFTHHMDGILSELDLPAIAKQLTDPNLMAVCALIGAQRDLNSASSSSSSRPSNSPWSRCDDDWRSFGSARRDLLVKDHSSTAHLSVETSGNAVTVSVIEKTSKGGKSHSPKTLHTAQCRILSCKPLTSSSARGNNDRESQWSVSAVFDESRHARATVSIHVNGAGATVIDVWMEGQMGATSTHSQLVLPAKDFAASASSSGRPVVTSPMPGRVVKVFVKSGQEVKAGDTLLVMEAMKMEHIVKAPCAGTVSLYCEEGLTVAEGSKLAEVVAAESA